MIHPWPAAQANQIAPEEVVRHSPRAAGPAILDEDLTGSVAWADACCVQEIRDLRDAPLGRIAKYGAWRVRQFAHPLGLCFVARTWEELEPAVQAQAETADEDEELMDGAVLTVDITALDQDEDGFGVVELWDGLVATFRESREHCEGHECREVAYYVVREA